MQHRHRSMCRNWDVSSILVRSVDCICYRSFVACPPSFACQPVLWYKSTQQSFCCTGVAAPPFSDLLLLDVLQSQTEKMSARRPLGGSGQSLLLDWPGLQAQAHFISDILPEFSLVVRLRVRLQYSSVSTPYYGYPESQRSCAPPTTLSLRCRIQYRKQRRLRISKKRRLNCA